MRRRNPFEVFISFKKRSRSLKYVKYEPSVYHVVYDQKHFLLGPWATYINRSHQKNITIVEGHIGF